MWRLTEPVHKPRYQQNGDSGKHLHDLLLIWFYYLVNMWPHGTWALTNSISYFVLVGRSSLPHLTVLGGEA